MQVFAVIRVVSFGAKERAHTLVDQHKLLVLLVRVELLPSLLQAMHRTALKSSVNRCSRVEVVQLHAPLRHRYEEFQCGQPHPDIFAVQDFSGHPRAQLKGVDESERDGSLLEMKAVERNLVREGNAVRDVW